MNENKGRICIAFFSLFSSQLKLVYKTGKKREKKCEILSELIILSCCHVRGVADSIQHF